MRDEHDETGVFEAVGATDAEIAKQLRRQQWHEARWVLGFVGAAALVAGLLVWLLNQ